MHMEQPMYIRIIAIAASFFILYVSTFSIKPIDFIGLSIL